MPYITGTIAAIEALTASSSSDGTGVFEKKAEDLSGGTAARETRDRASEIKGAQGKAIDDAKLKAQADLTAQASKAQGDALRRQQRQAGSPFTGTILTSPLGVPGQATTTKTVLGG